jgi:photosynthetic reaction center H subunit
MPFGAITPHIDVVQLLLYAFFAFFAGLIIYLRREDKREGYPLISERSPHVKVQGFPAIPAPKTFRLPHGGTVQAPRPEVPLAVSAVPSGSWPGAPLIPTGDPMRDGVGPAAYAQRADEPDMTFDTNEPKIVPLRVARDFTLASEDPDPRGMKVLGLDGGSGGTVRDLWVDRSEFILRYLEVENTGSDARVLVPMNMVRIDEGRREVKLRSVLGSQVMLAPGLKHADRVTLREEDRICAYFAGGHLYATPQRQEPIL